jgi:myo-inositol 2-dehydrogenase/D-chiro-inositol 1-dehydrogenase
MKKTIDIGLVGAGRIGAVHAATIQRHIPEARIAAIADPRISAATTLADRVAVERVLESPRQIMEDESIDAVLLCSSTETHPELVVEAARAGKQVFCEKPLALEIDEIERCIGATRDAGVLLQVGFNRRFDPDFARLRELVHGGAVGEVHLVRITSRDPEPPPLDYVRSSGGLFVDMMIHDIDMARFLTGREVVEVTTTAGVLVDPAIGEAGDVDTAVTTLRFDDGALCTIDNSRRAVYGYDQRVEVFGSGGMVQNRNRAATATIVTGPEGPTEPPPLHFFMDRYLDAYRAQLEAFVLAVQGGGAPPVGGEDALEATRIAQAARRSHDEARTIPMG